MICNYLGLGHCFGTLEFFLAVHSHALCPVYNFVFHLGACQSVSRPGIIVLWCRVVLFWPGFKGDPPDIGNADLPSEKERFDLSFFT